MEMHPQYDFVPFERKLVDPSPVGSTNVKMLAHLPDYVQHALTHRKKKKREDDIEYEHFYILLKFALNRQLYRLRPYYFTPDTLSEEALQARLDCANPRSVLISSLKLHICAILQLIYDYYQSIILSQYWSLSKSVIHSIIADDRNRRFVNIQDKKKNNSTIKGLNDSEAPMRQEPDEEPHEDEEEDHASSTDKFSSNVRSHMMGRSLQSYPYKRGLLDTLPRSATSGGGLNISNPDMEIEEAEQREIALMPDADEEDMLSNAGEIYQNLTRRVGNRSEIPGTPPSKKNRVLPGGEV